MANCVPVLLTDAQAKAKDEIHWTNEVASDSGQIQDKRKAVKSPDNSPKSKPNVKRNKESKKKDNMTVLNSYESSKQEERSGKLSPHRSNDQLSLGMCRGIYTEAILYAGVREFVVHNSEPQKLIFLTLSQALVNMQAFMQTITPDQSPQLPMNLPQPPHLRPGYTTARVRPGAGQQSSRMLPPTTSRVSGGNPQATELGMSNAQLLRLQHDAFQRMASMPEYRSNHFVNQHRASMASGSRPGFNLEQHGLGNQQQYGGGLLPAFESGFQAYQNRPVYGFNDGRINQPMAQGILQSLAQARQKSMAGPQLPAPGSLTSSRQSSRQASTEHLPSSLDSNAPGQRGTQNHKVETGGLLVKHEVPSPPPSHPDPLITTSQRPSTPLLNDPFEEANNPTLRIRIYSGLLDPTSTPIFSILTMRRHDPFGPRLEYYCTQRGALFGRDWKFVFKYHAPTPHDPNATRYLDIPFDLTPSQCIDTDYPAAAMRDGDTIVCVRNTKPSPTSELHAAMDCQRIDIANGETRVWQDRDVNAAWYNDLEASQASTKRQVGAMHGTIMSLRREKMEDGGVIEGLREENAKLKVELAAMRLASLRDAKEDFATEDEEDTKF
jgi:hypothetical protein